MTALQRYQLRLLLQQEGYSPAAIRAAEGGASFFSLNAGTALTRMDQFDAGLFINDDRRIKPNFTLSYGLRYEVQTNIRDYGDWRRDWESHGDWTVMARNPPRQFCAQGPAFFTIAWPFQGGKRSRSWGSA